MADQSVLMIDSVRNRRRGCVAWEGSSTPTATHSRPRRSLRPCLTTISGGAAGTPSFGRHFLMKNYRLPRQAWDTHEETLRGKFSFLQGDASAIRRRRQIHHRDGGSEGGGRRQLIRRWWCVSNGVREDTAGDGLERVACRGGGGGCCGRQERLSETSNQ